jgi:heme exporter protein D
MILNFLNMGGYGFYIWLSYSFALVSLYSLYYFSSKQLKSVKHLEAIYSSSSLEKVVDLNSAQRI